ncbi:MAG: hypothetical protein WBR29_08575 [Gammaproteobacteria bacterium]
MKCQIQGCDHPAIINDDDDGDLCLCTVHAGVQLDKYAEIPAVETDCQCEVCVARRQRACAAYKTMTDMQVTA